MSPKIKNTFTQKEIADSLNNSVLRSLRPAALGGEITEARLRKLRAYAQAALAPMLNHVEEDFLQPEELVVVLTTAAFFVQLKHVMHTEKLPLAGKVVDFYEGPEQVLLPAEYFASGEPRPEEILPRVAPLKPGKRK